MAFLAPIAAVLSIASTAKSLFGKEKKPSQTIAPPPPPAPIAEDPVPAPTLETEGVAKAVTEDEKRRRQARGRAANILTGSLTQDVGGSDQRKTLLGA